MIDWDGRGRGLINEDVLFSLDPHGIVPLARPRVSK